MTVYLDDDISRKVSKTEVIVGTDSRRVHRDGRTGISVREALEAQSGRRSGRHFQKSDVASTNEYHRVAGRSDSGAGALRVKIVSVILTLAIFLFTPFVITMFMSGVVDEQASDALSETRKVNVKYKNGSQSMDVSKYLACVLASRLTLSQQPEVIKAESIMLRTKIYKAMGDKMSVDSDTLGMDFMTEKEMRNQWGDAYTNNYNLITDCISATNGMLLSYNGKLIDTYYHEVSAGKTRSGQEYMGTSDYDYLQTVTCDEDQQSPDYLSVVTFTYQDFVDKFSKYTNNSISIQNPADSVQIVLRDSTDYVLKVQVGNVMMSGEEFAAATGINSPCFWMETADNHVKITTKGKGSGLGMSIYSADLMAQQGSDSTAILNRFFQNVTVTTEE